MKLILCAGTRHIEGYKHHDVKAYEGTDYVCDLFNIKDFVKEGECEEIHFTHALEHFPKADVPKVLGLIYSLLKEGGRLYIEVPNFAWHSQLCLVEGRDRDAIYYAFGGQLDEWDFHKTGFTEKILDEDLRAAGFKNVEVSGYDCLKANCIK